MYSTIPELAQNNGTRRRSIKVSSAANGHRNQNIKRYVLPKNAARQEKSVVLPVTGKNLFFKEDKRKT